MPQKRKTTRGRRQKVGTELTEAQWEIMKVVWKEAPCTAGTVQEELARTKQWAYSTIKTTMDRMVEREFLAVDRIRNLQLFRPLISEVDAKLIEFRKLLKRSFNGAVTPMMQFLFEHGGLSEAEADELRDLIDRGPRSQ
jgi:BlaI family penicillinase repressor